MSTGTISPSALTDVIAALQGISKSSTELAHHCDQLANAAAKLLTKASAGVSESMANIRPKPTREDCQDPRNKIGVNLSPRGIEMIYRLFDHDSSVRAASIAMGISHRAAKWRKGAWEKAGGKARAMMAFD